MKTTLRGFLAMVMVGTLTLAAVGCAASRPKPTGPIELNGSKWKLAVLGGRLDGRVVQFRKVGKDGYLGTLVDLGNRLRNVTGLDVGYELFSMKLIKENQYDGVYKSISPDGTIVEKELTLFVDGDNLSWNQESAVWERVYE